MPGNPPREGTLPRPVLTGLTGVRSAVCLLALALALAPPAFAANVRITTITSAERIDDASSLAAMQLATDRLGRSVGGSTGTNLCGAFRLIAEMRARGETGSVVSLICDGGERYRRSYYDSAWLAAHGLDLTPPRRVLEQFLAD